MFLWFGHRQTLKQTIWAVKVDYRIEVLYTRFFYISLLYFWLDCILYFLVRERLMTSQQNIYTLKWRSRNSFLIFFLSFLCFFLIFFSFFSLLWNKKKILLTLWYSFSVFRILCVGLDMQIKWKISYKWVLRQIKVSVPKIILKSP